MTEQTQKIWEAFCGELIQEPTDDMREALATAIRAVAKQSIFADVSLNKTIEVVPVDILLAIAKELEAL
jgi:hypothetical protein